MDLCVVLVMQCQLKEYNHLTNVPMKTGVFLKPRSKWICL